jgi:ABC-type multidrug transport system fused ATPase/permease subunit
LPDVWVLINKRRKELAIGFVLIIVSRLAGLVLPWSTKPFIDEVIGKEDATLLAPLCLAVLAATLVQALSAFSLTQVLSKSGQRLITEMRKKVQVHIGRLPLSFYDSNKTGALVSRIMSDVEGIRNLVGTGLVQMFGGIITASISLGVLFSINFRLTLIVLVVVVAFALLIRHVFTTIRPVFRERTKIRAAVTGRLTESLGGIRVVKGYRAEEREAKVFSDGVERLLENIITTITGTSLVAVAAQVLLGAAGALVMYFGGTLLLNGTLSAGNLTRFTMFLAMMVAPLFQMVNIATQLMEAAVGLERTREVFSEAPEDSDPRRTESLDVIRGEIEFKDVDFSYIADEPVLSNISFVADRGSVTALVGSSGSGKSTTIGLISAFYTPDSGSIWVDGVDLSTVSLESYRSQLGLVLQDNFLFDGTIRENIAFPRPDATEAEILDACRIARVDEFVERLVDGLDTIVGERGVKLSGGQVQRVAIARAVLANPRILILDEATSSLDSESEALIQEGLSYLMQGRTTFVIAHRLSTIRRADQILVLEGGRVVERGNHHELLEQEGRYHDLYTRQYGLEKNLFLAPGEGDKVVELPTVDYQAEPG